MEQATIDANRAQQATLYGRPLGELVRDLTSSLGLSQAKLADVLGMSAPMLSQLASGQRVKIGNPRAVSRLQDLLELVPVAPDLPADVLAARVAGIGDSASTISTVRPAQDVVARLAALSNATGLLAAADAAEPHSGLLAEALRSAAAHHG